MSHRVISYIRFVPPVREFSTLAGGARGDHASVTRRESRRPGGHSATIDTGTYCCWNFVCVLLRRDHGPSFKIGPQQNDQKTTSMRFEQSDVVSPETSPTTMAAYHPFLLQRPTDFSVSSLLTQPQYFPGSHPHYPGSLLPKLSHLTHPGASYEEVLAAQQAATAAAVAVATGGGPGSTGHGVPRPLRAIQPEEDGVVDDPKVTLEGKDLWERFHKLGTEMVITKSGRWVINNFLLSRIFKSHCFYAIFCHFCDVIGI